MTGARTRVMLVDDAVVVRRLVTNALSDDPRLEVVGAASDGVRAIAMLPELNPDVVVLDVEMPNMDGIETLAQIKKTHPHVKVIMFSTLTSRGADATLDALTFGADDYVCKPANVGSVNAAIQAVQTELAPKIKALHRPRDVAAANVGVGDVEVDRRPLQPRPVRRPGLGTKIEIVTVAISTGGPNALAEFVPRLPKDLAVPVVVVQHIPPVFSKALADRLDSKSPIAVGECIPGEVLSPGKVWIAPGDFHMVVRREGNVVRLATNQGPPENSCRPAADVLFRSVADTYGASALGLVMTGMGSDGLAGSESLIRAGAHVIVQDEATSVVWGMPGAVAGAGLADAVLPLAGLADEIVARVGVGPAASVVRR